MPGSSQHNLEVASRKGCSHLISQGDGPLHPMVVMVTPSPGAPQKCPQAQRGLGNADLPCLPPVSLACQACAGHGASQAGPQSSVSASTSSLESVLVTAVTTGDRPCPHSMCLPAELTPEFQAPVSAGPRLLLWGTVRAELSPASLAIRLTPRFPPVSQGKSQSAGSFPPVFPCPPGTHALLSAPDCRAEARGGTHLHRGPPLRHWVPGGCHFSRVFSSSASCPPSPFPQAQGPVPLQNNSLVTRLPERHTPSWPEVRRRGSRGFQERAAGRFTEPGDRAMGTLCDSSWPGSLLLAHRLPSLFQLSRGAAPTSAATHPCPGDVPQSPWRVLLPTPAARRHFCSTGSAWRVPSADLAVLGAGASLAPVTPASLLGAPSAFACRMSQSPGISSSSPRASRAVISVSVATCPSLPSLSLSQAAGPAPSLPAGSVFVLLTQSIRRGALLVVTPASSSHLWPPPPLPAPPLRPFPTGHRSDLCEV